MKIREMLTVWGFDVDTEELERTEKKLKSVQDAAGKVFAVSGAAIAGMVAASSVVYDNIVDSLTITNVKGQEFIDIQEEMLDMTLMLSDKTNTFAAGVSKSFYGGISSGAELMSDQFNALTETALIFGKVVKMDTGAAIESLSDVTQGLGKDLTEVNTVANGLFLTSKQAATNVPQLVAAFEDAGPVTDALNRTFNETLAILGALAKGGKKGAGAGTAFRSVMTKLAAPNAAAKKSLDLLKVSLFDGNKNLRNMIDIIEDLQNATKNMTAEETTQLFKNLAGEEGFATLSLLMKSNIGQMKKWEAETKGAGNVLQEAFDKKMNSPIEQFKKLAIGIGNIGIAIGRHFRPPLVAGLKVLNSFISAIAKFLTVNKAISALIALLITLTFVISGLIFAYVSWKIMVLGLTTAYKALGINITAVHLKMIAFGLIAAAAILIVALALNDLYNFFKKDADSMLGRFIEKWDYTWDESEGIVRNVLVSITNMLIKSVSGYRGLFQNMGEILTSPWTFMYTVASSMLLELYNAYNKLTGFIAKKGNVLLNFVGLGEDEDTFNKGVDIIANEDLAKLSSFFDSNIANIAATEHLANLSSSSIPSATTTNNSSVKQGDTNNSSVKQGDTNVTIQIDGSKDPVTTGKAVKDAIAYLIKKSNNDFKTKVAY